MSRLKIAAEGDATPAPEHPPLDAEDANAVQALMLAAQVAEEMGSDCTDIRTALLSEARRIIRREHLQPPDET